MGFKSLLDRQVQGLMKTLGQEDGLAPAHNYVEVGDSNYNTVTMTSTPTEIVHSNIPMVLARFTIKDADSSVVATTDQKALIANLDLPVTPKEDDVIRLTTGENYQVMKLMSVPGASIYILHIRKTT